MPHPPTMPPPGHADSFTLLTATHVDNLTTAVRALNMSIVQLTDQIRRLAKLSLSAEKSTK